MADKPCLSPHPFRTRDRGFAPELEVLGSYASDHWLRCRECGAMFWSVTDSGKYGYEDDWQLDPELARRALIDHDPKALARMFVTMNLPYGPVWEMTSALVGIFRALTPDATDAERARAIEEAGPHDRWSEAARVLALESRRHAPESALTFPIDVRAAGASFREWYEVGDALVLLTEKPELFRLEPRGLVQLPLAAPPRFLAAGKDRLMLAVGEAVLVIDAAGQATASPSSSGPCTVTALDDGWWLFVPVPEKGPSGETRRERFVELHYPDGRPRVKFKRAFAEGERWMAPPRRFADGWIFSNLTDVDDSTQALTLFDASFKTVAASERATEGDRTVTPIDDQTFWAGCHGVLERWVRKGKVLECVESFEPRESWFVGPAGARVLIADVPGGEVLARTADGKRLWTYERPTSGATYGVANQSGVLIYDDERAHWLDLSGRVRRIIDVESAHVRVGNKDTIYLKTLAELWILHGEEARSIVVGTDAELVTTCGDDAILRRKDGRYTLVGPEGVRGTFEASCTFSVLDAWRGGPWIVEGDRIRGAFERNAHTLAEGIAVGLGAVARAIPIDGKGCAYAIVLPDGRAPVLVQQFSSGAVSVVLAKTKSWHPGPDSHAQVAAEVVAAAPSWAASHADPPTILETVLGLLAILGEAFGDGWTVSIPGTPDPTEMWVRKGSSQVGVFDGRVVISGSEHVMIAKRGDLAAAREQVVAAVRVQTERALRDAEIEARMRAIAEHLATKLAERLGKPCAVTSFYKGFEIWTREPRSSLPLAEISSEGDSMRVHAGAPGERGWDGDAADVDTMFESIALAVERGFTTLTIDRLVPGRRYRVIAKNQGLEPGELVRFELYDDIDNHYGEYVFSTEDGRRVVVAGDFSTPAHSPLADAYRYLEEADER